MVNLVINEKVNLDILSTEKYCFEYNPVGSSKDNMECYIKDCDGYSVRIYTAGFAMIKKNTNSVVSIWYESYDDMKDFREIKQLIEDGILIKEKVEEY